MGTETAKATSYGEIIRERVYSARRPQSLRRVGNAIGFSYEHVRKVIAGHPVASREFNDALCTYLGLDPAEMWRLAQLEKAHHRFGADVATQVQRHPARHLLTLASALSPPSRARLTQFAQFWGDLAPQDQARFIDLAKVWKRTGEQWNAEPA